MRPFAGAPMAVMDQPATSRLTLAITWALCEPDPVRVRITRLCPWPSSATRPALLGGNALSVAASALITAAALAGVVA